MYDKVHQFLLRTIASRGVLSVVESQKILNSFTDEEHPSVQDMVKEINDVIKPFQQLIKVTNDELTDEEVIVFMSLGFDDATKSQNIFSINELDYFRVLLEQIMTTETRQVTGIQALNLASQVKSITKSYAQKLLNTWCRMRYLDKDETNYALGVRGIHEFEGYLRQNMPDTIEECCLCKQIVFRGYNCPACAMAVHTRCLNRYLVKVEKWPCCKIDFSPDQLERMNSESSRLIQTQNDATLQSEAYNTVVEPVNQDTMATVNQDTMVSEMDCTQEIIPEISQRVRKRKRQD